jgi:hypothetical protein
LAQLAPVAVLLAISTITAVSDPWRPVEQQRAQFSVSSNFRSSDRRRITTVEARRMALEILRRAEAGRAAVAEAEARQLEGWEELS